MEECYFKLGEVLLKRFHSGESFQEVDEPLREAAEFLTAIKGFETKLAALEQRRQDWSNANKRLDQLEIGLVAMQDEFNEYCSELGGCTFKHEQELIRQDKVLEEIFAIPFNLQTEVNKRKLKSRNLESGREGFIGSVKAKTQIMYLKGLNQKDDWSIRKHSRLAGVKVFEHLIDIPATSQIFPIWDKLKRVQKRLERCREAMQEETKVKKSVEDEVRGMRDMDEREPYPWNELAAFFRKSIEGLRNRLSAPVTSAGREFRLARRVVGREPLDIEKALSQLEESQESVTRALQKL